MAREQAEHSREERHLIGQRDDLDIMADAEALTLTFAEVLGDTGHSFRMLATSEAFIEYVIVVDVGGWFIRRATRN